RPAHSAYEHASGENSKMGKPGQRGRIRAVLCPISLRQLERFFAVHFAQTPGEILNNATTTIIMKIKEIKKQFASAMENPREGMEKVQPRNKRANLRERDGEENAERKRRAVADMSDRIFGNGDKPLAS